MLIYYNNYVHESSVSTPLGNHLCISSALSIHTQQNLELALAIKRLNKLLFIFCQDLSLSTTGWLMHRYSEIQVVDTIVYYF